MKFEQFKIEADTLIHFYAVTPPDEFLEKKQSVFNNSITMARLTIELFRDIDTLIHKYGLYNVDDEFANNELIDYAGTVAEKFRKAYNGEE